MVQAPLRIRWSLNVFCRVVIGMVLCVSGFEKVFQPEQFANALAGYGWIPSGLTSTLIFVVPSAEILLGIFLMCGLFTRVMALSSATLFIVYTMVILIAIGTGNTNHSCGCFTVSAHENSVVQWVTGGSTITFGDIIRDVVFILTSFDIYFSHSPQTGMDSFWQRYSIMEDIRKQTSTRRPRKDQKHQRKTQQKHSESGHIQWLTQRFNMILLAFGIVIISIVSGATAEFKLQINNNGPLANANDFHPVHTMLPIHTYAPNFTLNTLTGQTVHLNAERAKVVLLEFFAVWCPYCQQETAVLNQLERDDADKQLEIISIVANPYGPTVETAQGTKYTAYTAADVLHFERTYHVTHPVLIDPHFKVTNQYGITGYPVVYVIDQQGTIRKELEGPIPYAVLQNAIQPLLIDR